MFNLGFGELAVIFIVLIIAVGPDRLPTMMKGLGKTIRTVRQASRDIRASVGIDELMREDIMQPLPRRPVPKAAIARPPASAASLPQPAAADSAPTENARPADATTAEPAVAPVVQPAAAAAASGAPDGAPVPLAAPEPPAPAVAPPAPATTATPDEPAPRKD